MLHNAPYQKLGKATQRSVKNAVEWGGGGEHTGRLSASTGEINGAIPSSFMDSAFTVRTGVP